MFDIEFDRIAKYYDMLALMAGLSNLFSESDIPFIHYRITENLFCKYLGAKNLSRTDTAYDAKWNDLGIGIKTFTLPGNSSKEKIAEFNALSAQLRNLDGIDLAYRLADFRNERMTIANGLYGINSAIYHIIGRRKGSLTVFNTPYEYIDKERISLLRANEKTIHFTDEKNVYSFNKSKSVLMKDFILPADTTEINVEIIKDPFSLLENLLNRKFIIQMGTPNPQIILPLFSQKGKIKYVPEKSGLNQWNAGGRKRNENEVYIPIPKSVHKLHPGFFPDRNTSFMLNLPDGTIMNAKVCQQGGKALMSNPNKDLGEWLLRKVLHKQPDTLVTYKDLMIAGFDSIVITKESNLNYSLDVSREESFQY